MRTLRRWGVVVAGLCVLLLLPWAVAQRPVPARSITAGGLVLRIQQSGGAQYSGYAEATGSLALPVTDQFGSLADLFGGTTQLRVWWRGPLDWREDSITFSGENDVYRDPDGYWTWNYERSHATRVEVPDDPAVRLPRAGDLDPAQLARRLLSQATTAEVSRLPTRRIAGLDAVGLQLHPTGAATSIDHVDVWADEATGLALRVDVYAKGTSSKVITSTYLDFSTTTPAATTTTFVPVASSRATTSNDLDLLSAGDSVRQVLPATELAGLSTNTANRTGNDSVAAYGSGVTELVAVPLRRRFAGQLRDQLTKTGAVVTDGRLSLGAGPLNLLLLLDGNGNNWLLGGNVTPATLTTAADELVARPPGRR